VPCEFPSTRLKHSNHKLFRGQFIGALRSPFLIRDLLASHISSLINYRFIYRFVKCPYGYYIPISGVSYYRIFHSFKLVLFYVYWTPNRSWPPFSVGASPPIHSITEVAFAFLFFPYPLIDIVISHTSVLHVIIHYLLSYD